MSIQFELNAAPKLPERRDYRIGIIGSGFIVNQCHLPAYRKAGYIVKGISSRTRQNAVSVAEQFAIPTVYSSVDDMLEDPEIDVVDIAVPPQEQTGLIAKAAKMGKHILAQKPIAMSYLEAKAAVEVCQKYGVKLAVNQNGRYDPAILAAKSLLDQGLMGKPVFATIELRFKPHWQPYQEQCERLMYLFMSIHHLDQFRYLFGLPLQLYASSIKHPEGKFKGEYLTSYILNYENGMMASAWDDGFTWDSSSFGVKYKIEGTFGVIKMNIGWPSGGPSTISLYSTQLGDVWFQPNLQGSWFPDAFQFTMGELFTMISSGKDSHISGSNNLATMAMVEACYVSDQQKRAVPLQEILQSGMIK